LVISTILMETIPVAARVTDHSKTHTRDPSTLERGGIESRVVRDCRLRWQLVDERLIR
jgi:hypothetical protein